MLTIAPRLHIRRPSPTTAEFTVSTRPDDSLGLRLVLAATHVLRLVLVAGTLLVLHAAWLDSPYAAAAAAAAAAEEPSRPRPPLFTDDFIWYAVGLAHASGAGRAAAWAAGALPAQALIPAAALALWAASRRVHAAESLLVLRGMGIQTSSSGRSVVGAGAGARFIPTEKIQDVLLNEAFLGPEARYYLLVVVEGEEDVVVVFPRLLPGRAIVEEVWREARRCLYEPDAVRKIGEK